MKYNNRTWGRMDITYLLQSQIRYLIISLSENSAAAMSFLRRLAGIRFSEKKLNIYFTLQILFITFSILFTLSCVTKIFPKNQFMLDPGDV